MDMVRGGEGTAAPGRGGRAGYEGAALAMRRPLGARGASRARGAMSGGGGGRRGGERRHTAHAVGHAPHAVPVDHSRESAAARDAASARDRSVRLKMACTDRQTLVCLSLSDYRHD